MRPNPSSSQAAKGLFSSAVIESGGPFHHSLRFARAHAKTLAAKVGCDAVALPSRASFMACMRNASVGALVTARAVQFATVSS